MIPETLKNSEWTTWPPRFNRSQVGWWRLIPTAWALVTPITELRNWKITRWWTDMPIKSLAKQVESTQIGTAVKYDHRCVRGVWMTLETRFRPLSFPGGSPKGSRPKLVLETIWLVLLSRRILPVTERVIKPNIWWIRLWWKLMFKTYLWPTVRVCLQQPLSNLLIKQVNWQISYPNDRSSWANNHPDLAEEISMPRLLAIDKPSHTAFWTISITQLPYSLKTPKNAVKIQPCRRSAN